jgi:hypothetical protein
MADTETAAEVLREIVTNLGGTGEAQTIVPLLIELRDLLGEGGIGEAVREYLTDHGVSVRYDVDEAGNLTIMLVTEEGE